MSGKLAGMVLGLRHRRALSFLRRYEGIADDADAKDLRTLRAMARQLHQRIGHIIDVADTRLTNPGSSIEKTHLPLTTEWSYRPDFWSAPVRPNGVAAVASKTQLSTSTTIYHDSAISELTVRQVKNTGALDFAPFGLRMDVFNFEGSFISLAISAPDAAIDGLRKNHIVRVGVQGESEKSIELFARLNLRHGPNTEQIVREIKFENNEAVVEFDLEYTNFNENRAEKMWIDLIFESPSMNQISLFDFVLSRHQRADL